MRNTSVQTTLERRREILESLSVRRNDTYRHLAEEYGVSRSTIIRDIEELSLSCPIYTIPGRGGGIYMQDGYYVNQHYMKQSHETFLRGMMERLSKDEQEMMEDILKTCARPNWEDRVPKNS